MIEVIEENSLVLKENMWYGDNEVVSVINIDRTSLALCTNNGIEVYNKNTKELTLKIPKHKE